MLLVKRLDLCSFYLLQMRFMYLHIYKDTKNIQMLVVCRVTSITLAEFTSINKSQISKITRSECYL